MASTLRTLAIPVVLLLSGCEPNRLTSENFGQIHEGMTKAEVRAILGDPYQVNFSTMPTGREEQWYYGNGGKTAAISFRGDTVVFLGSTGLEE